MRVKNKLSWVLGATAALALVGPASAAEEALPMCDPLVSAFFRFATAGNSNTSGPWRDSYPGCNAQINSLSHTKNGAGYTTDDGMAAAPCLNLPYGGSNWGLLSGTTYNTPCKATGTLSKNIPSMSDPNNGWTIGLWVKVDSTHTLASKPTVYGSGLAGLAESLSVNSLIGLAGDALEGYESLVDLFKSSSWNYVALTYNPAYPTTNNAYRLYLNIGNTAVTDAERADMHGGAQKGVVPYTLPFNISGTTVTIGGEIGAMLDEPKEIASLGTVTGLKVNCFCKVDDMMIINRCLTSNEVVRLCSKAETYVFLTKDDASGKYSFSTNHNWSSTETYYANHSPEAQRHYLVDEGRWLRTATSGSHTFGGDSLTLGRVGGTSGNLYLLTTGTATTPELRLNNGQIKVGANSTFAGNVALKAASLDIVSDNGADRTLTWSAVVTNSAAGKDIHVSNSGSKLLKVKFDVPSSFNTTYAGKIVVDGSKAAAAFPTAKFANITVAPEFQNGASLMAAANNDTLAGLPGLKSVGDNYIDVPAGETFTLATTITGNFTKRGAGTLILQTTGTGKVNLSEGTMLVDPESANNVGNVTGGILQVLTAGDTYGTASYTGSTISGGSTLVFDVNAANGSHDAMALSGGSISSTAQNPIHIKVEGALTQTNSFALFTVPAASGVTADNFDLASVVGIGFGAEIRVADGPNNTKIVYVDVDTSARYVIAEDTFEGYAVDTATTALDGWTAVDEGDGVGGVAAEAPELPSPITYPCNDAAHTKVLEIEKNASRSYPNNVARDNQILESLVKVTWSSPEEMAEIGTAAAFQVAVTFDEEGWLCVYHPDGMGVGHWSRLYFGTSSVFARNSWVRLSCVFDYNDDPNAAWGQVRVNGSCGVVWDAENNRASDEGVRSPRNQVAKGSWFKLFPKALTDKKVSQFDVKGQSRIDDVVLAGYEKSLVPFEDGEFGATQGSFSGSGISGNILYSILDNRWGLPRDLYGDSDGDGYTDGEELLRHSNPFDAKSTPKTITFMIFR